MGDTDARFARRAMLRRRIAGLGAVLLAGLAAHASGVPSPPDDADAWRSLAEPVFRQVPAAPKTVQTMAQTDDGLLWFGSPSGLTRWDGVGFQRFAADRASTDAVPDPWIWTLHTDPAHTLWLGTGAGGLARLVPAHDRFVTLTPADGGLRSAGVRAAADDAAGGLWLATDGGLDHVDAVGRAHHGQDDGLPTGGVRAVLVDGRGTLWVGGPHGLYGRPASTARFQAMPLPAPDAAGVAVSRLMLDAAGRLWIGTKGHGVYTLEAGAAAAVSVADSEDPGVTGLGHAAVSALLEVADGEVWAGTFAQGLYRIDLQRGVTQHVYHHDSVDSSLRDNVVDALFRDRNGLVWVCTETGVASYDPRQRTLATWFGHAANGDGLAEGSTTRLLPMPDGTVWLARDGGGVDVFDPARGRVGRLRPEPGRPLDALPGEFAGDLAHAADGGVWLATPRGLYHADAHARAATRTALPGRASAKEVLAVLVDPDDPALLWVGGEDGLIEVRDAGRPTIREVRRVSAAALGGARVDRLFAATSHGLWVATQHGLLRVDTRSGDVQRPPVDQPGRLAFPQALVTAVVNDARGRLWIGSFGDVRLLARARDGHLGLMRRWTTREGLPNDSVDAMLADNAGNIWVSTEDGLARIDADTLTVRSFGVADGLGLSAYFAQSAGVTPSGTLLFGAVGGLTVVDPSQSIAPKSGRAPVVVTAVDGRTEAGTNLQWERPRPPAVTLPSESRDLRVDFAVLDFADPERNRYAYRLRGFDERWVETDAAHRQARYTRLPPGDYTLQLRGAGPFGDWSGPIEVSLRVLPAWYQTHWFAALVVLLAIAAIAATVQGRTVMLRRRQRSLESQIRERTAELEFSTAELRRSEARLTQMAYCDGLTGLPNRRFFNDELSRLLSQAARGTPFTLLLIDLDEFKRVNDTHGHDAGDALLAAVAERLNQAIRAGDRAVRLGGDEFAVLLSNTCDRAVGDAVCQRILDGLRPPVPHAGAKLQASSSIGAAACAAGGGTPEDIYKRADRALYEAKHGGRNQWAWDDDRRSS